MGKVKEEREEEGGRSLLLYGEKERERGFTGGRKIEERRRIFIVVLGKVSLS